MKPLILATTICLCAAALGAALLALRAPRLNSKPRKQWKENAESELNRQVNNPTFLTNEILTVKSRPVTESEWANWISDDLILMTNGEWMAYRNVCAKEEGRIADLVIGRGSDGKWYYSTFHFCIGMINLKTMEQPESLPKFQKDYFLREFDGHSDESLKRTWPPKR
jgi:hypothetical protein